MTPPAWLRLLLKLDLQKFLPKLDLQKTAATTLEKESVTEKYKSPALEASVRELEFIVRHASGKQLSEEQVAEVQHYAGI
jgi:hypothetical protein